MRIGPRRRSFVACALMMVLTAACTSGASEDLPTTSSDPTTVTATTSATGPASTAGSTSSTGTTGTTGSTGATAPEPTDPPSVEPAAGNVACSLLTEDVAEPIIGVDLGVASDVMVDDHSTCVLRDATQSISVELRMTLGRDADDEYETLFSSVEGQDGVRELDGLGDRAFRAVAGVNAHVLVLVDETLVRLSTAALDGALADETQALAERIVARL